MPTLLGVLINWFPMMLLIAAWFWIMRQMQAGGGKAMGFGKSRAKLLTERQGRVTFEDVAGVDEAKDDLKEIVDFLRDPQKFQRLGGRIPKGVLLVGPPGTGKTLLARAIAGEANVPFFTISGSDFVEMFVGVGASRVRDMFEQAKKNAPCIVFVDEIDAVGRPSRRRPRRRQRRARADPEPIARRDGRLRGERGRHPHRRDQPSDVLDPALLASGPLRPRDRRAQSRPLRPREDPARAYAQGAARHRRRRARHRARHAGLLRRRSRQPRQRGGFACGAPRQARRDDERARGRQGQGDDGRRAALARHVRRREEAHCLPRGGSRHRRPQRRGHRSDPQGDHHPARPRAGHGDAPAGTRSDVSEPPEDPRRHLRRLRRPRRRGADLRPRDGHDRRLVGHPAGDAPRARDGHALRPVRRARPHRVRREPGRGLPRPQRVADPERLGGHGAEDRRGDPPHHRRVLCAGDQDTQRPSAGPQRAGPRPARIRDADGRRDHRFAQGHRAGAHGRTRSPSRSAVPAPASRRPAAPAVPARSSRNRSRGGSTTVVIPARAAALGARSEGRDPGGAIRAPLQFGTRA